MTNEEIHKRMLELIEGIKKGYTLGELQGYSPEEIEVIYSLGYSSYQAGRFDEAEKIFRFACMFAHLEPKYYLALGGALAAQRKYAEAIPTYAYVLMLELNNVEAYACIADCYLALGNAEEARNALDEIVARADVKTAEGREAKARALAKLARTGKKEAGK